MVRAGHLSPGPGSTLTVPIRILPTQAHSDNSNSSGHVVPAITFFSWYMRGVREVGGGEYESTWRVVTSTFITGSNNLPNNFCFYNCMEFLLWAITLPEKVNLRPFEHAHDALEMLLSTWWRYRGHWLSEGPQSSIHTGCGIILHSYLKAPSGNVTVLASQEWFYNSSATKGHRNPWVSLKPYLSTQNRQLFFSNVCQLSRHKFSLLWNPKFLLGHLRFQNRIPTSK